MKTLLPTAAPPTIDCVQSEVFALLNDPVVARGRQKICFGVLEHGKLAMKCSGKSLFRWLCRIVNEVGPVSRRTLIVRVGTLAVFLGLPLCAPPAALQAAEAKDLPAPKYPRFNGEGFPEMRAVWDRAPSAAGRDDADARRFRAAEANGRLANEAFYRCRRYIDGWLAHCDPKTGLFPRNLTSSNYWNGKDSAADNYPFMVLTAAMTDRPLMQGRLLDILRTETRLTSRVDRLPDDYSFDTHSWRREEIDLDAIIFEGAEYVKDGLLPITEWLGPSPWSERMIGIIDDIWKNAPIETPFGRIPTRNFEVNGDLLQACARMYWFTGERKYLDWAIRLGDYYLLGAHHPTRDMKELVLMDHGCEVVNGLTELYVACSYAAPEKQKAYQKPIREMFDTILKYGRNEDGLLYTSFKPQTGEHSKGLCDTWGYNYDGFYTMFLTDKVGAYRDAVRLALSNLKGKYLGACWADKSADGFADSIEGAINLYNREPIESTADWIDSQTRLMWAKQHPNGIIEGWHGDGNFARTSLMYALWKTAGATIQPWRADVRFGAVRENGRLFVSVTADQPWSGRIVFDQQRHKKYMHLPFDYPRINQFPEWFTVEAGRDYSLSIGADAPAKRHSGKELAEGVPLSVSGGAGVFISVSAVP